jgi:hypothetical protein
MRRVPALVLGLVVLPLLARAQTGVPAGTRIPVQAGATIDRDSVTVGDLVTLRVRVHAPRGATINFPAAVDSLGPVQSIEPPVVRDGPDTLEFADRIAIYRLAPWDVGSLPIRLGEVLVQTDDDERRVALPLPSLFVRSVLPADSALRIPRPARPLIEPRLPIPWWWWLVAALVAVALGVVVWWARRRRGVVGATGDPYADAESAFERIERLRLPDVGEPGRHAALMTDVVRRYLAARIPAAPLALTSGELLATVRGVPTISYDRLHRLLAMVDPIKFAAAPIHADEARALGAEARAIVRAEHDQATAIAATPSPARAEGDAAGSSSVRCNSPRRCGSCCCSCFPCGGWSHDAAGRRQSCSRAFQCSRAGPGRGVPSRGRSRCCATSRWRAASWPSRARAAARTRRRLPRRASTS